MKRRPRIEIVPVESGDDRWAEVIPSDRPHYLRVRAANGEIVLVSEMYATRSNARRAARNLWSLFGAIADDFDLASYDEDTTIEPIREISS